MHKQARFRMLRIGLLILPVGLMAAGCGSSQGTVSGKVTFKGELVRGGTVMIVPDKGAPGRADIEEDGTYKIRDVPVGPAKVAVETDSMKPNTESTPQAKGAAAMYAKMPKAPPAGQPGSDTDASKSIAGARGRGDEKRYVAIPKKYSDSNKSGLNLTVKGGSNTFDIDLK